MRVAIYCRVSTGDQSCDGQERDLLEYAAKAGYEVVGIWKETASGAKLDRSDRTHPFIQPEKSDSLMCLTRLCKFPWIEKRFFSHQSTTVELSLDIA